MLVRTIPANGVLFGLVESTEPIIKRTLFNWRKNEKMLIVPPIQVFTQVFVISAMWLLAPYYTTHYYLKPVFIIFILYYIQYYLYM